MAINVNVPLINIAILPLIFFYPFTLSVSLKKFITLSAFKITIPNRVVKRKPLSDFSPKVINTSKHKIMKPIMKLKSS